MTGSTFHHLQLEMLFPGQIERAVKEKPLIYIPLGAMEWHGLHLPIGLDSFTSHQICLRVAEKIGGLVYPPLYYGMTGSIWHHPWTILIEEEDLIINLLLTTLRRLEACSIKQAVIFTGHFAQKQLQMLAKLKDIWTSLNTRLVLQVLSISECPETKMDADHGGLFETSLLNQLIPDLVHLDRLPDLTKFPANDPNGDVYGNHRRDPDNILFGILGKDPRYYDEIEAEKLLKNIIVWVQESVEKNYNGIDL